MIFIILPISSYRDCPNSPPRARPQFFIPAAHSLPVAEIYFYLTAYASFTPSPPPRLLVVALSSLRPPVLDPDSASIFVCSGAATASACGGGALTVIDFGGCFGTGTCSTCEDAFAVLRMRCAGGAFRLQATAPFDFNFPSNKAWS